MPGRSSPRSLLLASLLALACGPGAGGTSDAGSGGAEASSGEPTTGASATTAPLTTTAAESSTSRGSADESTTGPAEPVEYVGTWSSGFGSGYFTACGETEEWLAQGLPGFEICNVPPLWLRVMGVLVPPEDGGSSPTLQVVEILEGPCLEGSCDGSVPIGGMCGTFDELCNAAPEAFECDPFLQDCAPADKCMPWGYDGAMEWNGTRCAPLAEPAGAPGEPCAVEGSPWTGLDDCALGAMCWDVDGATNEGVCAALCDTSLDPDPACPTGTCTPFFTGDPPWTIGVCVTG